MKRKTTLLGLLCLAVALTGYSQASDAEADAKANLLIVQKRELVSKLVNVSGKDSAAFWKIYDEYQTTNKANTKARIQLYEGTAISYGRMTPAVADSLAAKYFVNRGESEKTLEEYYKKIKAATNAVVAFEFYQAETYLLTQIRATIMQQIPTYGELERANKK